MRDLYSLDANSPSDRIWIVVDISVGYGHSKPKMFVSSSSCVCVCLDDNGVWGIQREREIVREIKGL